MSRALRLVVTLAAALCAWLWVGAAEARELEAPRCDGRGATTFAAPPTMQPLFRSLQVLPEADECTPDDADVCGGGRSPTPPPDRVLGDPVLPAPVSVEVGAPVQTGTLGVAPRSLVKAPSHAGSIERPPR